MGPGFNEIATKYKSDKSAETFLVEKIIKGGSGSWGNIPMPAQTEISATDIKSLVTWILKEGQ